MYILWASGAPARSRYCGSTVATRHLGIISRLAHVRLLLSPHPCQEANKRRYDVIWRKPLSCRRWLQVLSFSIQRIRACESTLIKSFDLPANGQNKPLRLHKVYLPPAHINLKDTSHTRIREKCSPATTRQVPIMGRASLKQIGSLTRKALFFVFIDAYKKR